MRPWLAPSLGLKPRAEERVLTGDVRWSELVGRVEEQRLVVAARHVHDVHALVRVGAGLRGWGLGWSWGWSWGRGRGRVRVRVRVRERVWVRVRVRARVRCGSPVCSPSGRRRSWWARTP